MKYWINCILFQEFAESTMNEMLGWYGYETSRRDLQPAPYSHSNSTSSGSESPKFTGTLVGKLFLNDKFVHFFSVYIYA